MCEICDAMNAQAPLSAKEKEATNLISEIVVENFNDFFTQYFGSSLPILPKIVQEIIYRDMKAAYNEGILIAMDLMDYSSLEEETPVENDNI